MTKEQKQAAVNLRDSRLIEDFRNGNQPAFETLVNLYRKKLIAYNFWLLKNKEEAEDATQDELMIVHDAIKSGKYRGTGCFEGFIKRIARIHKNVLKRKNKLPLELVEELPDKLTDETVDDEIIEEKSPVLLKSMEALPPRDKELLILRFWKKQSWKQVAKALDIEERSASGQSSKIIKKIKKMLIKNKF